MSTPYDDIIGLPHPDPQRHPRMKRADRAAQFAPFAALTGFDQVIDDTARDYYAPDQEDFRPGDES